MMRGAEVVYNIRLTERELAQVLSALAEKPYNQVVALIGAISGQVTEQEEWRSSAKAPQALPKEKEDDPNAA